VHQDPVAKSKRVTNSAGTVVSTVELDPWGGNTNRSNNDAFQPRKFTTYERDGNASDEAMHRRYNRWWSRFDQPDPYDGSYNLGDPQSFNRYAYVNNDPVNVVDPTGLDPTDPPSTTVIDPATGLPTSVPGVNGGVVTIGIGGLRGGGGGGGGILGGGGIDEFEVGIGDGPQESPQTDQNSNCLTINKLLEDPRLKNALESAVEN
jgi:RHS repeat-associated protein